MTLCDSSAFYQATVAKIRRLRKVHEPWYSQTAFRSWYRSTVVIKRNNYRFNYGEIAKPSPLRNLGTKIGIQCTQAKKVIAYSHAYTLNRYIVHEHQNVIRRRKRDRLSRRNNSHTVSEIAKSISTFVILDFFLFLLFFPLLWILKSKLRQLGLFANKFICIAHLFNRKITVRKFFE